MEKKDSDSDKKNMIGSSHFYNIITGRGVDWQDIIHDLIRTEQLDPWDIDIGVLADRYVIVVQQMEEADFFISSKVLLACSLLLRIKSERLLYKYIQELDEAMYGKQDEKKYIMDRIELDENEIPILVPKTPMSRFKKVTLQELMGALHKAIETENRRIRKDIKIRQAKKSVLVVLPNLDKVPLKERISSIFQKIKNIIQISNCEHSTFSQLSPSREEKLASFLPLLHLSNSNKIYLTQREQFGEVYVRLEKLKEEIEELIRELGEISIEENNLDESDMEKDDIEIFDEDISKKIIEINSEKLNIKEEN